MKKGRRKSILLRDGFRCAKCGAIENLTIDHIIPKSLGGINKMVNLQTLCEKCNSEKGANIACYVKYKKSVNYVKSFTA